jgi:conjugative transposon TraM protein
MDLKKISFRKTKYGLPLIILPFLLLGEWVICDMFPAQDTKSAVETGNIEGLNAGLPDPNLLTQKDKLDLLNDLLSRRQGLGGLQGINVSDSSSIDTDEMETILQSFSDDVSISTEDEVENALRELQRKYFGDNTALFEQPAVDVRQPQAAQLEELAVIKAQLARMDSMLRMQNVNSKEEMQPEEDVLFASKANQTRTVNFNTISNNKRQTYISAILDEAQTVVSGSRIRIRLLDDIFIGDKLFKQGAYLYGLVSGFSAQRVNVDITSVLYGDQILKTKLTIYDNDGIKGLYVPNSDFRQIMQMAGSRMTQSSNMNINSGQNAYEQMLSQMGQDFYRTVTSTVSQRIRQNRAKLKYSSIIYLINEDSKQKNF